MHLTALKWQGMVIYFNHIKEAENRYIKVIVLNRRIHDTKVTV